MGIKPLCVGLAGVFAFDLFSTPTRCCSAGSMPTSGSHAASPTRWSFRSSQSRRRATPAGRSRCTCRAASSSTRRRILVSGVFLLVVAAAGYFVRYFGGDWGSGAADRASVRGDCWSSCSSCRPAAFDRSSACSSASISSRTATTIGRSGCASRTRLPRKARCTALQEQLHQGAWPISSRARAARCGCTTTRRVSAGVALEHARRSTRPSPRDGLARRVPRAHRLDRRPERVPGRTRSAIPDLVLPDWLRDAPSAWLVVPLIAGRELIGFVVLANPRTAIEVNWEVRDLLKTASRQAASYLGQIPRDRSAARGAQVRRLQPDVRVCRPRPQEPCGTAFAHAEECRTSPRQSRVPARHAGDRRARGRHA